MASALIKINGVVGSNTDLPINTLVQLDNQNSGGETTFLWSIVDQPPGAVDSLSATNIQNPTFTPKKEGSYLIKLIVNQSLPSEVTNFVIAAVKQMKTRERVPAAQETIQTDASRGWATDVGHFLQRVDSSIADPGVLVGIAGTGGLLQGNIVRATASTQIKTGLPGQEILPSWVLAPATSVSNLDELLGVVEGGVDGSPTPGNGAIIRVRIFGRYSTSVTGASAVVGEPVFVSDTGGMVRGTPGTNRRVIGSVLSVSGGNFDVMFFGGISEPANSGTVLGSGSATQIAFWSGTNAITGDNNLWWDNSTKRLGVGTSTVRASVHVHGGRLRLTNSANTAANANEIYAITDDSLAYTTRGSHLLTFDSDSIDAGDSFSVYRGSAPLGLFYILTDGTHYITPPSTPTAGSGGSKLYIGDASRSIGSGNANIHMFTNDSQAANLGGSLGLGGCYSGTTLQTSFGYIWGRKENSTNADQSGYLAFGTRGTSGPAGEAMRITSTLLVGIGTTTPQTKLHIVGTSGTAFMAMGTSAADAVRYLDVLDGSLNEIRVINTNTSTGTVTILAQGTAGKFAVWTNNPLVEQFDIIANGRAAFGNPQGAPIAGISAKLQILGGTGDTAVPTLLLGSSGNTGSAEFQPGQSAGVSNSNTGRLRYNSSTQHFEISENGAAYIQIGTGVGAVTGSGTVGTIPKWSTTTALTDSIITESAGTVSVGGLSLTVTSSNTSSTDIKIFNSSTGGRQWIVSSTGQANSFGAGKLILYDNTVGGIAGSRLLIDTSGNIGIGTGTNAVASKIDLRDLSKTIASGNANMFIFSTDTEAADLGGSISFGGTIDTGGTNFSPFGYVWGRKENSTNNNQDGYLAFGTRVNAGNAVERARFSADGGFQIFASTSAVSASSTGRIRYNSSTQHFEISENGGAYTQIGTGSGTLTGTGTTGKLAKWTGASSLGDSIVSESGTVLTVAGDVNPEADNTRSLGTTALRWASLHLGPGSVVVHNDATNTIKVALEYSGGNPRLNATGTATLILATGGTAAITINSTQQSTFAGTVFADAGVDRSTAAALSIGVTNASSIAIGQSGITTTITGGLTQLTGAISLTANNTSSITTSSGPLTITSFASATWSSSGTLSINGATGLNLQGGGTNAVVIDSSGNITLGNASTNTVAFTAQISSATVSFTTGTSHDITVATSLTGNGNFLRLTSGAGLAASGTNGGNGGSNNFIGGAGGAGIASFAAGTGGNINITSGAGGAINGGTIGGGSGNVLIGCGLAGTGGAGGTGNYNAGSGGAGSGTIAGGSGGAVGMAAGNGGLATTSAAAGTGGTCVVAAGTGGAAANGNNGGTGGAGTFRGGTGGTANTGQTAGTGGSAIFQAGNGGASAGTGTSGPGGTATLQGGNGGSIVSGTGAVGGAVIIDSGAGSGAATGNTITIGGTNATGVNYGNGTITHAFTGSLTLTRGATLGAAAGGFTTTVNGNLSITDGASNDAYAAFAAGQSAAVSASNTGRLRYNASTQHFEISENGAAYAQISGMAIGSTVTSGITGSVLFVASGPVLAQDNANFFWDSTNHRLGIGTTTPSVPLHIITNASTNGIRIERTSATVRQWDISVTSAGRFDIGDNTGSADRFQIDTSGNVYIPTAAVALLVGSGTVSQLSDTTFSLHQSSPTADFHISQRALAAGGTFMKIDFGAHGPIAAGTETIDSSWNLNRIVTWATGTLSLQRFVTMLGPTIAFSGASTATDAITLEVGGPVSGTNATITNSYAIRCPTGSIKITSGFLDMGAGSTFGLSVANRGRLRYNESTQHFEISENGGAYTQLSAGGAMSIGGTVTSGTTGSILFVAAGPVLAQDNSNFFWDNTNKRLGLAAAANPLSTLQVSLQGMDETANLNGAVTGLRHQSKTTNARTALAIVPNGTSTLADLMLFSSNDPTTNYSSLTVGFDGTNTQWHVAAGSGGSGTRRALALDATGNALPFKQIYLATGGNVGINTTNPGVKLHVVDVNQTVAGGNANLALTTTDTQAADVGGSLLFGGNTVGTGSVVPFAYIWGRKENGTSGNELGYLALGTRTTGTAQVAMVINSLKRVGIGETAANIAGTLHLRTSGDASSNVAIRFHDASGGTFRGAIGIVGTAGQYASNSAVNDTFVRSEANLLFSTSTSGTQRMNITSTGLIGIGTDATAPAYLLDIRNSTLTGSIHLRCGATNSDTGMYMIASSTDSTISNNANFNGTNWVAKATSAGIINLTGSNLDITLDTSLTAGNTFSPTLRFRFWPTHSFNIGTSTSDPGIYLNIEAASAAAGIAIGNGSSLAVSASNTGRIRYNSTSQHFQISENGTAYTQVMAMNTSVSDSQLTTTGATTVTTFTPPVKANHVINIYYRVVTATTNVTISVTYTDGTGSQTYSVVPITSTPVGSYIVAPLFVNATAAAITVTATAGTANQVFVSASITGI